MTINFYSTAHAYGEFSNFASYPVEIDGKTWKTTEHYFQAMKFEGTPYAEEIRKAKIPMIAALKGRSRKRRRRRGWEGVKLAIMRKALEAKFTQHPELRELLLSTGDEKLVEHTEHDEYWGDGGDGSGRNWLGRLLMELREKLVREGGGS